LEQLMFKIGQPVVHPHHGVGRIFELENREFEPGVIRRYYTVSIRDGGTVWVPVDLPGSGLRKLATRREIADCRKILASIPLPLSEDRRLRQAELTAHLKQGTINAHCEVVRDAAAYSARLPGNETMAGFLRGVQAVLSQEWAMAEEITVSEAVDEIEHLLKESQSNSE
jgi:RNA polymerase-interacting CarD/CdnL/TRCF family regulator